jgi:hypothetical protein
MRARGFALGDILAMLNLHFTHWIDLNRRARGARVRPVEELLDGLSYLRPGRHARTDIVVFTLAPSVARSGLS